MKDGPERAALSSKDKNGKFRAPTLKDDKYLDAADIVLRYLVTVVRRSADDDAKIRAGKVLVDLITARYKLPAWGAPASKQSKRSQSKSILDALTPDQRAEIIRTLETQQGQALADERKPEAAPKATDTPSAGS